MRRGSTLKYFDQALVDSKSGCLRQLFCGVTHRANGGGGAATPRWRTVLSHACHDDSPLLLRRSKPRGQVKCSGKQSPVRIHQQRLFDRHHVACDRSTSMAGEASDKGAVPRGEGGQDSGHSSGAMEDLRDYSKVIVGVIAGGHTPEEVVEPINAFARLVFRWAGRRR
jgi:hypothetical protein